MHADSDTIHTLNGFMHNTRHKLTALLQASQTPEQGARQGAAATDSGDSQASRSQEQQHTPSTRPETSPIIARDQLLIGPQPTRGFVI